MAASTCMASATRSSLSNLRHFFSRLASVSRRPNNAFKPKPLRSAKHMAGTARSEEHTSELQSLMRISYAVFCLKKKNHIQYDNNIKTLITHHLTTLADDN